MTVRVASGSGTTRGIVLSVDAVAERLAVSRGTVYRLVRSGALPHTRVGGSIRIAADDLAVYLACGRSNAWRRVDGRGRPRAAGGGKPLAVLGDRQAALTKRHRWAVLAGEELLDVGEADERENALVELELRMREFHSRPGLLGRYTAVTSDGFQLSVVLPLSYFDVQRFLASAAGQELSRRVEAFLAANGRKLDTP